MTDSALTYETLAAALDRVADGAMFPSRPGSMLGFNVVVSPDIPKVRLNYKVRTKYGDEFEFLTKAQQDDLNAWLLAKFGTVNAIPDDRFYVMQGMGSMVMNPRSMALIKHIA